MDASKPIYVVKAGTYYLIPEGGQSLAKMDASAQKVLVIPTGSADLAGLAKEDSMDRGSFFGLRFGESSGGQP
jgi:hypothetical protein